MMKLGLLKFDSKTEKTNKKGEIVRKITWKDDEDNKVVTIVTEREYHDYGHDSKIEPSLLVEVIQKKLVPE